MTQKGKVMQLQYGAVTGLMSHLANLPEREKSPDDPVSLPEVFRRKDYMTEIRNALKRGYTFEDLSKIFTEKCGVSISARQLKYHYTRGMSKPQTGRVPSPKLSQKGNSVESKERAVATKPTEKEIRNDAEMAPKAAKSGSFDIDMAQEDI